MTTSFADEPVKMTPDEFRAAWERAMEQGDGPQELFAGQGRSVREAIREATEKMQKTIDIQAAGAAELDELRCELRAAAGQSVTAAALRWATLGAPTHVKPWGAVWTMLDDPQLLVQRIGILAGGTCSRHAHNYRWNRFYVRSGSLIVEMWPALFLPRIVVDLTDGGSLDVPPHVVHRFTAAVETWAWETYWSDRGGAVQESDIVRWTTGGIVERETVEARRWRDDDWRSRDPLANKPDLTSAEVVAREDERRRARAAGRDGVY